MFGRKKEVPQEEFTGFNAVVNTRHTELYIRVGASRFNIHVTSLPKGSRVTVYGREGAWYKVKYKSTRGYAHVDYILPLDQALG